MASLEDRLAVVTAALDEAIRELRDVITEIKTERKEDGDGKPPRDSA